MSANCVTEAEIVSWVKKTLKNNVNNYKISITGKSGKGDGNVGDIIFVCATGRTDKNKNEALHFVVKHGKRNEHLRSEAPLKEAFDNEIYVYDKIFPLFEQFQCEKNIQNRFDSVAKCYNTLTLENMEVIVLDNLKERGYEMHDRKKPFNMCHLKTVLKEYGKLHALSFAVREQRPEEFNKIAAFKNDMILKNLETEGMKEFMKISIEKILGILKERNELQLLEQFMVLVTKYPVEAMNDLMKGNEPQSVITHGDCWNNNFMFKYQNADKTTPSSVAIVDWQQSAVRSPVFDLSYLIYATAGAEELDKFEELLQFYYASFSTFLKDLGCSPEKIFSYSSLEAHWRKYALSGLSCALMVLPMVLCDQKDAPALDDLQEGQKISEVLHLDIKDNDLYFDRVKPIISHFFQYTSK